ncbi:MAG: NUDIX domain-containing protein [Bacteroidales bacterium]|nr:NUDIX domain-containing protein [Bacteroidales bacterium]
MHLLDTFKHCPKCGSDTFAENDFKSKRCGNCGFVYYLNPSAANVAVITDGKGNILVATRSKEPAKGTLDLPGGFCDCHESAEEGVIREVLEETGLKVTTTRYMFSIPNIYSYSGMEIHTMDLFFECRTADNANLCAADDVQELQWMAIEKLDSSLFGLRSIREGVERLKSILNHKE